MEEEIKILEEVCQRPIEETEGIKILRKAITNLINKYKEQEKIIELMAKELAICGGFDYIEFGMSTGDFNKDIRNMIDYFKKKAKGE